MEKTKSKNNLPLLFALMALLYFTSYMTRLNLSAAKALLIVDLKKFTKPQVGAMGTALFFSYGLGQIISGVLSDKFKPEKIISLGLITTCICNALVPVFSESVLIISIVWGLNGLAQAFFWPPIVRLISKYTNKKEYTKGVWIVSIASYIATLLVYVLVPFEINYINWSAAFRIPSAFALLVLILWSVLFPVFKRRADGAEIEHTEEEITPAAADEDIKKGKKLKLFPVIISSGAVLLFVAVAMQGFFKDGLQDWFPTLLSEGYGMDASYATFSNVLLPIFSIITMSFSTVLYEKVFKNEVKEAIVFFAVTVILCGSMIPILKFKVSAGLLLVLAALVNSCLHGINAMFTCFAPRRYLKEDKVATMSGLFNACSYMGGAISSYGIGTIAENLGWEASLYTWGGACIIGIIACVFALKKWNKYIL